MAQNPSLFPEIVDKYFAGFVGKITKKINDKPKEQQLYHKLYLTEEFSVDANWGSSSINDAVVSADVVALESSVPLKSRGAIRTASGTIPKLSIGYRRGEKALSDLRIMAARGANEAEIVKQALNDVPRVIKGIDVANEIMFLQGLSTGVALIPIDEKNGVRADFGYKEENIFKAKKKWSTAPATPLDDIRKLFDKAETDGVTIEMVTLSPKYLNLLRSSAQGKEFAANYRNAVIVSKEDLPMPSRELMLEALRDEFGCQFVIISSSVQVEKNDGTREVVRAYEEDRVIALPSSKVGRLVYSSLVEEDMPVAGVSYQKSGSYTLVSKFSSNNPLTEFTTAQAIVLPVIDNSANIYMLKANEQA